MLVKKGSLEAVKQHKLWHITIPNYLNVITLHYCGSLKVASSWYHMARGQADEYSLNLYKIKHIGK